MAPPAACTGDVEKCFERSLADGTRAAPVAAIEALLGVIERSGAQTMHGLQDELCEGRKALVEFCEQRPACLGGRTELGVSSGCELFLRHVTRTFLEFGDFSECRDEILRRGRAFAAHATNARDDIAGHASSFLRDGSRVLVHGRSRVVQATLKAAAKSGVSLEAVVVNGADDCGACVAQELREEGITTRIIADAAVAREMEVIDVVLVGAEAVAENGGVVNKVGTLTVACCARAMRRPLYVAAESYKFARAFPLGQRDLPNADVDYTPPDFIELLFTDLGVLTPAAVSDELIRLYQ